VVGPQLPVIDEEKENADAIVVRQAEIAALPTPCQISGLTAVQHLLILNLVALRTTPAKSGFIDETTTGEVADARVDCIWTALTQLIKTHAACSNAPISACSGLPGCDAVDLRVGRTNVVLAARDAAPLTISPT